MCLGGMNNFHNPRDLTFKTLPNWFRFLELTYQFILVQEILVSIPGTWHLAKTVFLLSCCNIQARPCTLMFHVSVPPYFTFFWNLLEFPVKRMIHWYVGLQWFGIIILCGDFVGNGLHLTYFKNLRSTKLGGNSKMSKVSYWILALNMQDHPFWGLKIVLKSQHTVLILVLPPRVPHQVKPTD